MSAKEHLRSKILTELNVITATKLQEASEDIATQLRLVLALKNAQRIGVFAPFKTEPNLITLYEEWRREGKELVFPAVAPEEWPEIDIILVPGLAFTTNGDRLGRGRGYYDRALARLPRALKIGVCFAQQVLPELPLETHDQKVDLVIFDR